MGRLKTGISVLQAQSNIDMALARISRSDLDLAVVPMNSASLNNERKLTIWLLLGMVAFLLLMESVSVLSLFRLRSEAALKRDLKPSSGFWP
jgi:heme/copper-type cytochrome/quinol oxidase subunit 2